MAVLTAPVADRVAGIFDGVISNGIKKMPERILAAIRQTGDYALWGTGLGVIAGAISGHSAYDLGAVFAGIGAGFYGLARGAHRIAEAYMKYQEAQAIRMMCKGEYVKRLQHFVCYNADGCLDRKTEPDEAGI